MSNIEKAIADLSVLQEDVRLGNPVDDQAIEHVIDLLMTETGSKPDTENAEQVAIADAGERKVKSALSALDDLDLYMAKKDPMMLAELQVIREAIDDKPEDRSGPVIVKNKGIIVAVTWQDGEGRIEEVLAESCGYPDMKAREAQALETIQNLVGAFDNPITRRKSMNKLTAEAIKQGRAYIEQHKPDEDEDLGGLEGV